jgi:hypothetical protein
MADIIPQADKRLCEHILEHNRSMKHSGGTVDPTKILPHYAFGISMKWDEDHKDHSLWLGLFGIVHDA